MASGSSSKDASGKVSSPVVAFAAKPLASAALAEVAKVAQPPDRVHTSSGSSSKDAAAKAVSSVEDPAVKVASAASGAVVERKLTREEELAAVVAKIKVMAPTSQA